MNNEIENEIWKTYPEINWIQGSNFGRVRTIDKLVKAKDGRKWLKKGQFLSQWRGKKGYLYVSFKINGKTVHRQVHRIIASCFIKNPFDLPEVNHRDCNIINNFLNNLEWCTHQYNMAYKEKYGTSAAEVSGRPVYAVNLKTLEVLRFETQSEASRELRICNGNINNVLKGRYKQAGGYWFTEDGDRANKITKSELLKIVARKILGSPVYAVGLKKLEVLYFRTQTEAGRRLEVASQNVGKVVKGRYKQTGGYWFTKADNNAVESTRAKFGDKVADKVGELMSEK